MKTRIVEYFRSKKEALEFFAISLIIATVGWFLAMLAIIVVLRWAVGADIIIEGVI